MRSSNAERGIALLRIVFGFWLLRTSMINLVWQPWPWPSMTWVQGTTAQWAAASLEHPSLWVRYLLQQMLIPQAEVFNAVLLIWGMVVGLSLTFGLLTVAGGLLGLVLGAVQFTLSYYLGELQAGYFLFQSIAGLVFALTRAGRRWGFDAFLAGINSKSPFF